MRKRTRFKSLLLDFFVILFCLSAAAFFAWLFWKDLNSFTVRSDKAEIGTISFKHNVAQRKFDDRVVWEYVASGTKLYYGDTIRTADLAQAVLTLSDGTVIDLGENTMIQVGSNASGGIQISIDGGDIQIDSTTAKSALDVKLGDGSVVNVDAGSSLAAKTDASTGLNNVEVKSGSAQITTENGQTASLAYGESVNVEKGKEIQKNAVTVVYPPRELKLINVRGGAVPVKFEWKTNDTEAVTIQTSSARDFAKIDTTKEFSGSQAELRLSGGVTFWRAFTKDTKDKSIEGKITVENISRIDGISPSRGTSFRYRTTLPRIAFRWSGNEYAERYRLLISSTPDMRQVVSDSEINGNFVSLDELEAGDYYWQVTPFYSLNSLGYVGESEVYSFTITKSQEIRRPELSAPSDNSQIVYRDNIPANFIWKSEVRNASYELTIARDYDFNNVIYTTTTTDTRYSRKFTPSELRDGTYYWKILRKSDEEDDTHPESEIRTFRVARYIPQDNKLLYPPENFSVEGQNIQSTAFMWKLADEYDKSSAVSVIQISSSANFQNIQIERTTTNSVLDNMHLPSGTYWWRVGVRGDNGALTGITQSRSFTVLSELTPPSILKPSQNEEVTVYNYAPVTVSWDKIPDAVYYSVKILRGGTDLVKSLPEVRDTEAQFVLEDGTYTCSIQAVASATRISVASERTFSVRAPSMILAQSPSDNTRIAGLTAIRNPLVFTWVPGKDRVSSYKFILSKIQRDGSSRVVETIDTTKTTVSMNRLTEGTYTWKVAASTSSGIPLDSKTLRFVVDQVPDLQSPLLTFPTENFVMTGDYLKNHRTLEFTWNEVSGATAYTFVLYKKEENGSRRVIYTERNTKASVVRIKDLSILSVGTFEWSVTPFSYAKDGYLEQKGSASSALFRISFDSPTRVEAVTPGKMYGN
ncbi:MAG: FecR domain-containing protein [Treponema sp.]|nr:FecR domain-containing protein [Treponema sp.]